MGAIALLSVNLPEIYRLGSFQSMLNTPVQTNPALAQIS